MNFLELKATSVVAIGGSGVIGRALARICAKRGHFFVSLSLDAPQFSPLRENLQIDVTKAPAGALAAAITQSVAGRSIVMILDIYGLDDEQALEIAALAIAEEAPVGLISSCLLYDHAGANAVDESCPLVALGPKCHPYLANKLLRERFWRNQDRVGARLLRCHHILGAGSLLGCIPDHNRDPELIARMRRGDPLNLALGGQMRLSWIHPDDLAVAALDLCADPHSRQCAINLAAPDPIMARAYFQRIARALSLPAPEIRSVAVDPAQFWSLTARDNVFVSRHDFVRDLVFSHDIGSAIVDALSVPEGEVSSRRRFLSERIGETGR
jgi:nucleoside-diphosphate-sugar epimerase